MVARVVAGGFHAGFSRLRAIMQNVRAVGAFFVAVVSHVPSFRVDANWNSVTSLASTSGILDGKGVGCHVLGTENLFKVFGVRMHFDRVIHAQLLVEGWECAERTHFSFRF